MAKRHSTGTPATAWLNSHGVIYDTLQYDYVDHGGTRHSATALGLDEHQVVKTLVMEDETGAPLVICMHGDREVATKELARQIGVKSVRPCTPQVAQKHSGYQVGGTSPFGLRKPMTVHVEASILDLDQIVINGGRRGLLVRLDPRVLSEILDARPVHCAA